MNKQYLLMIDECALGLIKQCFMGLNIQFLEVQGMTIDGGAGNVLMTPIRPPVPPMIMPDPLALTPQPQSDDPASEEVVE